MNRHSLGWMFVALIAIVLAPVMVTAQDGDAGAQFEAKVIELEGTVEWKSAGGDWALVSDGQTLPSGVELATGFDGSCTIEMIGGTQLGIEPLSAITIDKHLLNEDSNTVEMELDIEFGEIDLDVKKTQHKADAKISAPNSTTAIRGTRLSIRVDPEARRQYEDQQAGRGRGGGGNQGIVYGRVSSGVEVSVDEGVVEVTAEDTGEQIDVNAGERTDNNTTAPTTLIRLNELDNSTPVTGATEEEIGISTSGGGEVTDVSDDISSTETETVQSDQTSDDTPDGDRTNNQETQAPLPGPPSPPSGT